MVQEMRIVQLKSILIHKIAYPHTEQLTQTLLKNFYWEQFEHPLYSPDLALSDYHFFRGFKKELGG